MKLKLRKRKNPTLRKLVKTDETGNSLNGEPLYVLVEEVDQNVTEEGSVITPEVIDKINWKDDSVISFKVLDDNTLPASKDGVVQIVAKSNGEVYAVLPNGISKSLGSTDLNQFLKKNGIQYSSDESLGYFNLNKELKLFSTRTRLGAIPPRTTESSSFQEDGTYIEMRCDGKICLYVRGQIEQEISPDKLLLSHKNSFIVIDKLGKMDLNSNNSSLQLHGEKISLYARDKVSITGVKRLNLQSGEKFSIESNNTKIQETEDGTKFNCFTEYQEASYGNQNFRLQFYPDYVRLRDVNQNKNIIQMNQDGTIYLNDTSKVIDESTINNYIKNYLDVHFPDYYAENFYNCANKTHIFSGAEYHPSGTLTDSKVYCIYFSDNYNSENLHSIMFVGTNISNNIHKTIGDITYQVSQYIADDDQYGDYVEVIKWGKNGQLLGDAYIRKIYSYE
ncbi:MAG: hypothetical protein K2H02_05235 [Anaeroplasmataceae bacterium]|nr:hypothetical protein [Anaeroplasmataceae bacterium]